MLDLLFCFSPINYFLLIHLDLCAGGRGAVQGGRNGAPGGGGSRLERKVAPLRGSHRGSVVGDEAAGPRAGPDLVPWEGPREPPGAPGSRRGLKKGWGPGRGLFLRIPRPVTRGQCAGF